MNMKQYGVWFGAGTLGSLIAMAIYGAILTSTLNSGGFLSDGEQLLLTAMPWVALILSAVAILALAGFMNVVMDHISESRSRR
ncbi:hypothetical protein [Micrococcus terreus]|uniref:hypothetical protein n=1 Tax=Micrococcus terreus TaxID=574650 RepID=UPI0023F9067F|nr:hypothetical protein [Micrococcus terreus]